LKKFPDILGTELQNAVALLEAEGLDFIVLETKPPKRELAEGELRVIKTQIQDNGTDDEPKRAVITVCRI